MLIRKEDCVINLHHVVEFHKDYEECYDEKPYVIRFFTANEESTIYFQTAEERDEDFERILNCYDLNHKIMEL